jgi:hypothetical protein
MAQLQAASNLLDAAIHEINTKKDENSYAALVESYLTYISRGGKDVLYYDSNSFLHRLVMTSHASFVNALCVEAELFQIMTLDDIERLAKVYYHLYHDMEPIYYKGQDQIVAAVLLATTHEKKDRPTHDIFNGINYSDPSDKGLNVGEVAKLQLDRVRPGVTFLYQLLDEIEEVYEDNPEKQLYYLANPLQYEGDWPYRAVAIEDLTDFSNQIDAAHARRP